MNQNMEKQRREGNKEHNHEDKDEDLDENNNRNKTQNNDAVIEMEDGTKYRENSICIKCKPHSYKPERAHHCMSL